MREILTFRYNKNLVVKTSCLLARTHNKVVNLFGRPPVMQTIIKYAVLKQSMFSKLLLPNCGSLSYFPYVYFNKQNF